MLERIVFRSSFSVDENGREKVKIFRARRQVKCRQSVQNMKHSSVEVAYRLYDIAIKVNTPFPAKKFEIMGSRNKIFRLYFFVKGSTTNHIVNFR